MKRSPRIRSLRCRGFSMVEVVLAMAICTFCMLLMVGLLPVGLKSMEKASAATAQAQVLRAISSMARQADFNTLPTLQNTPLYFNADGSRVTSSDPSRVYRADLEVRDGLVQTSTGSRSITGLRCIQITFSLSSPRMATPRVLGYHSLCVANTVR